jgi:hypothetical protein
MTRVCRSREWTPDPKGTDKDALAENIMIPLFGEVHG